MERILLTGMSGTGKSSVVRELVARGYKAFDTDDGWSEPQPDGRQLWREDAIQALLNTEDAEVLFVAGCEENQAKFHAQFDQIVLLSAPSVTLLERLGTRTTNTYGKTPDELPRFLDDVQTIEPLLRRVASNKVQRAGGLLPTIAARVDAVELAGVHRFAQPWEAQASQLLRRGAPTVLDVYARQDRIHPRSTPTPRWMRCTPAGRRPYAAGRTR